MRDKNSSDSLLLLDKLLATLAPNRYRALIYLWESCLTAQELSQDCWQFACQLPSLRAAGITESVLRGFVEQGFAEHRIEITHFEDAKRSFQKVNNLCFSSASCFQLTPTGLILARQLCPNTSPRDQKPHITLKGRKNGQPVAVPFWDQGNRILYVGQIIVKQFKVPAWAQELVLTAYQEENWASHLDDPLPPEQGIDSKQRLHETIKRLNHHQNTNLIHFEGDGSGRGIRWRFHCLATSSPKIFPKIQMITKKNAI